MFTKIIAIIAATLLAVPAAAMDEYWNDDNWGVFSDTLHDGTPFCTLMASFTNDQYFGMHFVPTNNDASLSFILPKRKAANFAPDREVTMAVTFLDGNNIDNGWGDRKFTVGSGSDDTRIFTSSNMDAEVLMNDIAEGNTVGFTMHDGNRIVAAYSLSGSTRAVAKLRECGYSRQAP